VVCELDLKQIIDRFSEVLPDRHLAKLPWKIFDAIASARLLGILEQVEAS